jgi:hypothetical protein
MNSEKIQQLTESIHRTVEALNECCRTSANQPGTQASCNTFGSMPYGGSGFNPMGYGWSPFRVGSYPFTNQACYPTNTTPWQGWTGNSFSNPNTVGFTQPSWSAAGSCLSYGYSPVQTFGGTPAFNGATNPFYGWNPPTNPFNGFYGPQVTGFGMPTFGHPFPFQGTVPMGTWGPNGMGTFPMYGTNGFGFPGFGYGQPGFFENPCGPQNQQNCWTPNAGPTGVVDIPLAA